MCLSVCLLHKIALIEIKCLKQKWNANYNKTKLKQEEKTEKWRWESQTEVDNRVHPLHWATSPGPSPMGTDPINGLKMVQNGSHINFSNSRTEYWPKPSRLLSLKLQIGLQRTKKPNYNRVQSTLYTNSIWTFHQRNSLYKINSVAVKHNAIQTVFNTSSL